MTITDLDALRAAILADPIERLNWLAYADALEEVGDPRAELVRLMVSHNRLDRDGLKRLAHLRGTVPLLSEYSQARVEAIARNWSTFQHWPVDVANIEDVLRQECHPLLRTWGHGQASETRLIVHHNGSRWTWAGNNGQSGGGAYPNRAGAILTAFAIMSPASLAQIRWIEIR